MTNMGDYHDHYLRKDVLLLADIFKKFIDTCLKFYRLDPCHYFSSPGLSWDTMLKMILVKLEKISELTSTYLLKKDMRKPITNTQKIMILKNRQHL